MIGKLRQSDPNLPSLLSSRGPKKIFNQFQNTLYVLSTSLGSHLSKEINGLTIQHVSCLTLEKTSATEDFSIQSRSEWFREQFSEFKQMSQPYMVISRDLIGVASFNSRSVSLRP